MANIECMGFLSQLTKTKSIQVKAMTVGEAIKKLDAQNESPLIIQLYSNKYIDNNEKANIEILAFTKGFISWGVFFDRSTEISRSLIREIYG
ncbi:MAG: hypothetical protein HY606_08200 [Planctomycetes bacterium]|nr:hypothetical protein [Planctomycetota bacterium]